jgi:hypothetical protein
MLAAEYQPTMKSVLLVEPVLRIRVCSSSTCTVYIPEDTIYTVVFREMVSIIYWNLVKFMATIFSFWTHLIAT